MPDARDQGVAHLNGVWTRLADALDGGPQRHLFTSPGHLAKLTNPATVNTPALELIDQALVEALETPDSRLIISMAPQEGKSVRVANDFPVWALTRNPDLRIVTASYGQSLANRNGRAIRNRIISHPELGLTIAKDNGSVSDWTLRGHVGGVLSVGIGAGLTGRPADLMIIDDPIKDRKEADSKVFRDNVWDWWTDAASTRLAPGASVVLILTRWHEDDLAGRLVKRDVEAGWQVINIPAQADHRPEEGETDILGREPGEYMISARGRSPESWARRKATAGARTWASLFQGRPAPQEGGVFPPESQWPRYDQPLWITRDDGSRWVTSASRSDHEMVQSWDLAFKDTDGSDYVVGQVWLRIGTQVYLLDQIRERLNFTATLEAMRTMSARWPQAVAKFVEDKANGPAVINALGRELAGLIPIEPEGSKYARASAVSPFTEAGNVVLPTARLLPNVAELFEEMRNFPHASHDDTVDALSQALNRLLLLPLQQAQTIDQLVPDDMTDWSISPY